MIHSDSLSRSSVPGAPRRRWLWASAFGLIAVLLVLVAFAMRDRKRDQERSPVSVADPPSTPGQQSKPLTWEALGATPAEIVEVPTPAGMNAPTNRNTRAAGDEQPEPGAQQAVLLESATKDAGAALDSDTVDASPSLAANDIAATDAAAAAIEATATAAVQAQARCGSALCPRGQVCCNASCGICANAGEQCSQRDCSPAALPTSALCGINTCNVGYVCCNSSCGICARPGERCDAQICSNVIEYPTSVTCGMSTCNVGMDCCNASCGICAPPGQACSKDPCG